MFSFVVSLAAASDRTQTADEYWALWTDFQGRKDNFMPPSNDLDEHNRRFNTFMDNVDKINSHNAEGHSWYMGLTPYADMTAKQFKEQVIGSMCQEGFCARAESNLARTESKEARRMIADEPSLGNPNTVDWRSSGKVTRVKNQQACGSCWAFSATGAIESRYAISKGSSPVELSEQELVDCATDYYGEPMNCESGGIMQLGFEYSHDNGGLAKESEYKYTAHDGSCKKSQYSHVTPAKSYKQVDVGESYLENAVASGPVSVAIQADQNAFQFYSGGVFTGSCGTSLDHGVLIVGYSNEGSSPYWIMKNSWGTGWGEDGYMKMCKDCGKNGKKGQCGVAADGSFPTI